MWARIMNSLAPPVFAGDEDKTRAAVQLTIEQMLDKLPVVFTSELYQQKCEVVYQHVYDSYYGMGRSLYSIAGVRD